MVSKSKNDSLREAVIPLSTFSRSAFGVGFAFLPDRETLGGCSCQLIAGGEPEPEACTRFRLDLFEGGAAFLANCPAGLTLAALPLITGEGSKAVLLSEGFLPSGVDPPEPKGESVDARYAELISRRADDVPRLSPEKTDLLVQLMENLAVIYPLLKTDENGGETISSAGQLMEERGTKAKLVGVSEGIAKIRDAIPTFAESREPLLMESEQGNGRHLIAALLHRLRSGREGAFVCENLSVLPIPLQEQELFGPKGDGRGGLVRKASGGTLFLTAVEHLTPASQRQLHEHLATGDVNETARIIVSTDRNLAELVRKGRFRSDLHRRLSRLTLFIPPLRERKEDIPLLVEHILGSLPAENGRSRPSLGVETLEALQKYSWPGNVRELQSELLRAASYGRKELDLRDFSPSVQHAARPPQASMTNIREAVGRLETEIISRTLGETKWNKSQAARILGLSRLGLQKKIDRYGLDRRR
jgi:DNA-binding NtrC family response regulator